MINPLMITYVVAFILTTVVLTLDNRLPLPEAVTYSMALTFFSQLCVSWKLFKNIGSLFSKSIAITHDEKMNLNKFITLLLFSTVMGITLILTYRITEITSHTPIIAYCFGIAVICIADIWLSLYRQHLEVLRRRRLLDEDLG